MPMISADYSIALPIALSSIAAVLYSILATQALYGAYAQSSYSQIRAYAVSQEALQLMYQENGSYQEQYDLLTSVFRSYNVSVSVQGTGNTSACAVSVCRVAEIGGISKIVVVG